MMGWKRKLVKAGDTLMQDGPKRKLVMAGEAPMLVQQVHAAADTSSGAAPAAGALIFCFCHYAPRQACGTMFWPASAPPSAERRFRPHYNSSFYMFLSCLSLSQR